jgi:hypothetical protein
MHSDQRRWNFSSHVKTQKAEIRVRAMDKLPAELLVRLALPGAGPAFIHFVLQASMAARASQQRCRASNE